MTPPDRRQRFGFTLIELLMTVAIIGILATLLLGALSQAKAKAHDITCMGNLRQQALGFKMAADSDEGRLNRSYQVINGKIVDSAFETYMDFHSSWKILANRPQGPRLTLGQPRSKP